MKNLSIKIGLWCVGLSMVSAQAAQCYFDAQSAYRAMIKQQQHEQKIAERININTATASDFASLQGVGVNTAERIIRYRTQVGRFASVDELLNVQGIGQATLNKNRHRLSVMD